MGFIVTLHQGLSNTAILFFVILGVWGLFRGFRQQSVDGSYFGALVVGQLLFVVEIILGIVIFLNGNRVERMWIHGLYGAFALVFLPGVFFYLRGDDSNRAQWVYAFVTLFLAGIAIRSIQTSAG